VIDTHDLVAPRQQFPPAAAAPMKPACSGPRIFARQSLASCLAKIADGDGAGSMARAEKSAG